MDGHKTIQQAVSCASCVQLSLEGAPPFNRGRNTGHVPDDLWHKPRLMMSGNGTRLARSVKDLTLIRPSNLLIAIEQLASNSIECHVHVLLLAVRRRHIGLADILLRQSIFFNTFLKYVVKGCQLRNTGNFFLA